MRTMLDRLEARLPIWNAGMGGGLAGPELVAGVNAGGGVGVLGSGAMPAAQIKTMIARTRALTSRPFGANIILPMSDGSDIEACFDARPEVLILFWGDPQPFVADAHKRDMFVVVQCGGPEDAVAAADAGVDGVIIQGTEAGGHVKATDSLSATLPATVRALGPLPVIAAGGIATGAGINAALNNGASAVSLGSRFLACTEADALPAYKDRLVSAKAADTVLTKLFDIGWPDANHRVIRNATYNAWEQAGAPPPGARPGEGDEIGTFTGPDGTVSLPRYAVLPPGPGFDGDPEAAALYAGESVESISAILSVSAIMTQLESELKQAAA